MESVREKETVKYVLKKFPLGVVLFIQRGRDNLIIFCLRISVKPEKVLTKKISNPSNATYFHYENITYIFSLINVTPQG